MYYFLLLIFGFILLFCCIPFVSDSHNLQHPPTEEIVQDELKQLNKRIRAAPSHPELIQVPYEELRLLDVLGEGAFGTVHKGEWKGKVVAVKVLKNQQLGSRARTQFINEMKLMSRLQHENVVAILGACVTSPLCMITEYYGKGSLFHFLHRTRPKPNLSLEQQLKLCIGTARGLLYLHVHNPPIIHRDLKPANLLLDDDMNVKLADFGLSRDTTMSATMTGCIGTPHYMAPEVIHEDRYTEKADIYSLGIILWEILTGEIPYRGWNTIQIAMKVVQGIRPQFPELVPTELRELVASCWDEHVDKRPTCAVIIQHLVSIAHAKHVRIR